MFIDDTNTLRCAPPTAVAHALGLQPDPKAQREKGGTGYSYWRDPQDDPIVILEKSRRGFPVWWRPGGAATPGDWFALVQRLHPNLNIGQAKAHLRRVLGATPARSVPFPLHAAPVNQAPSPCPTLTAAPAWAAQWLAGRGLSSSAIRAAHAAGLAGLEVEAADGRTILNLAFPHTSAESDLIGAEIRGFQRSFKGFRGRKGFYLLPPAQESGLLCVAESAVDALALLDYISARGARPAWIISTAGRPDVARQAPEIEALARDLGIRKLVAAQDADAAGAEQAKIVADMADRLGATFKRAMPPAGCKDWADWSQCPQRLGKRRTS